jgi:PAS domain-containing protein
VSTHDSPDKAAVTDGLLRAVERNEDGMIVIDEEGVVLHLNPSAGQLFGRDPAEFTGEHFGTPVVTGEVVEILVPVANGPPRHVELRTVDLEWGGQPAQLISLRDFTERRLMEDALRDREAELMRLNRELRQTLDELRASRSHISEITGFLALCMDCGAIDSEGRWLELAVYLRENNLTLSHGLCPDCASARTEQLGG